MKKFTLLSAQPDIPYFHWQVEVFIHNAMSKGINPNWIEIVFAYDDSPSREGTFLAGKYPFVRFFFYKKTVKDNFGYIPILRPDVLEQHFERFPGLSEEPIFYHDSDIIFRELPDFDLLNSDSNWYLSDTVSYIGAEYIKSKGENMLEILCGIAGISPELVEENQNNSGGAQYLMKGINHEYWSDVKKVCLSLYKFMADAEEEERKTLTEDQLKVYNPIQKWCADMWAVFWCGLKAGHQIRISPELDFSWASSYGKVEWEKCKIFHNAGVVSSQSDKKFYKGDYIDKSPWDEDFSFVDPDSNSYNYVQAILYAKEMRKKF